MRDVTSTTTQAKQSYTDYAFQHSSNEFRNSATYRTSSLISTTAKSAKEFVKPDTGSYVQRVKNLGNSLWSKIGGKPAPVPAPVSLPEQPSVLTSRFKVPLPAIGNSLDVWHVLKETKLPISCLADDITDEMKHRSYNLFKRNLGAAINDGKKTLDSVLKDLPDLSEAKRKEISETFLTDLELNIGPEFDAIYKATRESPASANGSITMPKILMSAAEPALVNALESAGAKFDDTPFSLIASNFTFDIRENQPEAAPTKAALNRLPLHISLTTKAEKAASDADKAAPAVATENGSPQIEEEISTEEIWSPPFSSVEFLSDMSSPDQSKIEPMPDQITAAEETLTTESAQDAAIEENKEFDDGKSDPLASDISTETVVAANTDEAADIDDAEETFVAEVTHETVLADTVEETSVPEVADEIILAETREEMPAVVHADETVNIDNAETVAADQQPAVPQGYKPPGKIESAFITAAKAVLPKVMAPLNVVPLENPKYVSPDAKTASNPVIVEVAQKRPAVSGLAKIMRSVRRSFNRILLKPSQPGKQKAKPIRRVNISNPTNFQKIDIFGNSTNEDGFKVFPRQADVNNNRIFDQENEYVQLTKL